MVKGDKDDSGRKASQHFYAFDPTLARNWHGGEHRLRKEKVKGGQIEGQVKTPR